MSALLTPAVLATPGQDARDPAAHRVRRQSAGARDAVRAAAHFAGAELLQLAKNDDDAPVPSNGWHWSVSHDAEWVAGVVHTAPVGIDLERAAVRRDELVERTASPAERELFGAFDALAFARVWTAKEAVLKCAQAGLRELSQCRVVAQPSASELIVEHRGARCRVAQSFIGDHVVSVHAPGDDWSVRWPAGMTGGDA